MSPPLRDDLDHEDVARAIRGDTQAFERLYHKYAARIHTLARRIVGRDLAEDAAQDVFVHVWDQLGQFRGEARFGTWLHRVAVNIVLRYAEVSRRVASRIAPDAVDQLSARVPGPDARLDVDAALARLGPTLREVIVLHDLEGYQHDEIAKALGISVSASKMRLHRGRTLLRRWLLP